ncbi:hypothetical protein pb186bvf_001930 [Paramecium bursaria]
MYNINIKRQLNQIYKNSFLNQQILNIIYMSNAWVQFCQQVSELHPIDLQKLAEVIRLKVDRFPSDQVLIEYYRNDFTKSTNQQGRKKWHLMDKQLLVWCVYQICQIKGRFDLKPTEDDWKEVAEILSVDQQLIYLKWISLLHTTLRQAPWTPQEDKLLKNIARYEMFKGNNWTELTIEFNKSSHTQRYAKQIRERWNNVLNPTILKQQWTKEEKMKLLEIVHQEGKKWSKIQTMMPGRTENQIKNQYNGILRNVKKMKMTNQEEKALVGMIIDKQGEKINSIISEFITKKQKTEESLAINTQTQIQQYHPQDVSIYNQYSMLNPYVFNTLPNLFYYQQFPQVYPYYY